MGMLGAGSPPESKQIEAGSNSAEADVIDLELSDETSEKSHSN
ncbi:MAG: hypothetical protein ABIV21_04360 [Pyrinomonadaceae bacterium]